MELTIKSRKLDETLVFHKRPDGHHYIMLWSARSNHCPSGPQICQGGGFMGSTLAASDEGFEAVCRRWYRAYVKNKLNF